MPRPRSTLSSCWVCFKIYTRKQDVKRHWNEVHNPFYQAFPCTYTGCTKVCKQQSQLRQHVAKKHTQEPTASCKTCGEEFVAASDLTHHKKIVHGHEVVPSPAYQEKLALRESGKVEAMRVKRRYTPYEVRAPCSKKNNAHVLAPSPPASADPYTSPAPARSFGGTMPSYRLGEASVQKCAPQSYAPPPVAPQSWGATPRRGSSAYSDYSPSSSSSPPSDFSFAPSSPGSVATSVDTTDFSMLQNAGWYAAALAQQQQVPQAQTQTQAWAGNVYQPAAEQYQPRPQQQYQYYSTPSTPAAPEPAQLPLQSQSQYQYSTPSTPAAFEPAQPQFQPEAACGTDLSTNFVQDGFCDPYPQPFDFAGLAQQQAEQYAPVGAQQVYGGEVPAIVNVNVNGGSGFWMEPQQSPAGYQQYQAYQSEAPVQSEPFYGMYAHAPQASMSPYIPQARAPSPSFAPDNDYGEAFINYEFNAPTDDDVLPDPDPAVLAQQSEFLRQLLFGGDNDEDSSSSSYAGRY
ncbi:hypothetical protein DENSPDRAFT_2158 [Dentipellis sp. KUC8613]|nr:hypothetical protein DENSPDRAFT_2158 [Dentipellis sp. KUC8613]